MCSVCYKESLKGGGGALLPPLVGSLPPLPLRGGVISVRTLNQMDDAHRAEVLASHGLSTMLCGWFTCAVASYLAQRFAGAPAPPRLTASGLAALCVDLASPAGQVKPCLEEVFRVVAAGRAAYAAAHRGTFKAPNLDPSQGPIVAPSDELTERGFLQSECSPTDLCHWLRSQPPQSPQARACGIVRPALRGQARVVQEAAAAGDRAAEAHNTPMSLAHLRESDAACAGFEAAGRGNLRVTQGDSGLPCWVECHPAAAAAATPAAVPLPPLPASTAHLSPRDDRNLHAPAAPRSGRRVPRPRACPEATAARHGASWGAARRAR